MQLSPTRVSDLEHDPSTLLLSEGHNTTRAIDDNEGLTSSLVSATVIETPKT